MKDIFAKPSHDMLTSQKTCIWLIHKFKYNIKEIDLNQEKYKINEITKT